MIGRRFVAMVSAGAASAVAAKFMLAEKLPHDEHVLVYTDPGSEHPDNARFLTDLERWYGQPIKRIKNPKYADTWDVWTKRRFLVGPKGALCTTELKKVPRWAFEEPHDFQYYGFTAEEEDRATRFREQNPDVRLITPLIERGLKKADCLAMIERAGIALPAMYLLGYQNNNCIGCVKGGAGYWNKIRRDFPETFDRMAKLERDIGATVVKLGDGSRVYLDELPPDVGRYSEEPNIECGLLCYSAEQALKAEGAAIRLNGTRTPTP